MTAVDLDSFVALGLASCFVREGNELVPVQVVEPIPSAALLALVDGNSPTSYSLIIPSSIRQVLNQQGLPSIPKAFPQDAQLARDFTERLHAAARTFIANPDAKMALGESLSLHNPPTQQRILNPSHSVKDGDNVKQHSHSHKTL